MGAEVVVVGSVHTDFVASASRLPTQGETLPGHRFEIHPGGKGGNQAVAAAQAGAITALIARVGNDHFGKQLRSGLRAKGVDTTHLSVDSRHPTGSSTVLTGEDGDYASIIVPGAAGALSARKLDEAGALIAGCSVLLLQLEISTAPSSQAAAMARSTGGEGLPIVVLNAAPALDVHQIATAFGGMVDVVVVNAVEAGMIADMSVVDAEDAFAAASHIQHRLEVATVIVTLGASGSVVRHAKGKSFHPARPVLVVDTIGAGDAFVGALAAQLARGVVLDEAVPFAGAAGALAVTQSGAYDALPTRDAIIRFLGS